MSIEKKSFHSISLLLCLIVCALGLSIHLLYIFLADAQRFPVNIVKVSATYQHITRKQLQAVLNNYLNKSFFLLPMSQLQQDLASIEWAEHIQAYRIWPDILKITIVEKTPVAIWNQQLMTEEGVLFSESQQLTDIVLPHLAGPAFQQINVLQIYQKLSKLLEAYGLYVNTLQLHENQSLELALTNGVTLRLGKRDYEQRLLRFCRAYPSVFSAKSEQLSTIDLRYARGMAVQWKDPKQQTGK